MYWPPHWHATLLWPQGRATRSVATRDVDCFGHIETRPPAPHLFRLHHSPQAGSGVRPPTVSPHEVSTAASDLLPRLSRNGRRSWAAHTACCVDFAGALDQKRCLQPIFPSVTHRAAGSGCQQCHGIRCRLCRCVRHSRHTDMNTSVPSRRSVRQPRPAICQGCIHFSVVFCTSLVHMN